MNIHKDREKMLDLMIDEHQIREVLVRYATGMDRRELDLVRSCYHPDATDDHGAYSGGIDGFIAFCTEFLAPFENTMHFMGNTSVHVDGDVARSESYTLAYHHLPTRDGHPARDHIVAFRYIDDFTRRNDEWRIKHRRCIYDWTRTDPVPPGWDFGPEFMKSIFGKEDPVFAPLPSRRA